MKENAGVYMYNRICCIAEIITTLYINYMLIKLKKRRGEFPSWLIGNESDWHHMHMHMGTSICHRCGPKKTKERKKKEKKKRRKGRERGKEGRRKEEKKKRERKRKKEKEGRQAGKKERRGMENG